MTEASVKEQAMEQAVNEGVEMAFGARNGRVLMIENDGLLVMVRAGDRVAFEAAMAKAYVLAEALWPSPEEAAPAEDARRGTKGMKHGPMKKIAEGSLYAQVRDWAMDGWSVLEMANEVDKTTSTIKAALGRLCRGGFIPADLVVPEA